jgi:hypothetical protein
MIAFIQKNAAKDTMCFPAEIARDTEAEALRRENKKLRAALTSIVDETENKHHYFESLLSNHATKSDKEDKKETENHEQLPQHMDQKEKGQYEADKDLSDDYHRGFHSGSLAMCRLVLGLAATEPVHVCMENHKDGDCEEKCFLSPKEQRDAALKEFPHLDIR